MCKNLYLVVFTFLLFSSCSDFFEKDIGDKSFSLYAPYDSIETEENNLVFAWDFVEGATFYNFQIVSPSFNKIEKIVIDSNVTTNRFEFSLYPGVYQWSVVASNSFSYTESESFNLTVLEVTDLSGKRVSLISPKDYSNKTRVTLKWKPVNGAVSYLVEIRKSDWETGDFLYSEEVQENQMDYDPLENMDYSWGVNALGDNNTETGFFSTSFLVDTLKPFISIPIFPLSDSTLTSSRIKFAWHREADDGSEIFDSLFIYSDTIQVDLLYKYKVIDTIKEAVFANDGWYSWKLKTCDNAGNTSDYSSANSFELDF